MFVRGKGFPINVYQYLCVLDGARGVVYVVDSATLSRQIRDVAEFLFNLLTSPRIHKIRSGIFGSDALAKKTHLFLSNF